MKKQSVISQIKGQNKTSEKQLNEVELGNLLQKEFRIIIVKMNKNLRKRMEKTKEMFTKDLQELKNKKKKKKNRRKIHWKDSTAEYLRQKNG